LPPAYRAELRARSAPLIVKYGLAGDGRRFDVAPPQRVVETLQPTLF
jgi:hypothetical protein